MNNLPPSVLEALMQCVLKETSAAWLSINSEGILTDMGGELTTFGLGNIEKGMLPEKLEQKYLARRVTKELVATLRKAGIEKIMLRKSGLLDRVFGKDVVDPQTGEILI